MTSPAFPGRLLAGRYRVRSRIGDGGMGAVWLAKDELLGRDVAVKQIAPRGDSAVDAGRRDRALREGRLAAQLRNPHVIAVHDVVIDSDCPWLVMEYLAARSLGQLLDTRGVLEPRRAARIGADVAEALTESHAAGIVHRDVKPGNILVAGSTVKITDFGIAALRDDSAESPIDPATLSRSSAASSGESSPGEPPVRRSADVITGTPAYLAPEVARGHTPDERSDVYSLGATLYAAVEGSPPHGVDSDSVALLRRVAGGVIEPPRNAGDLTPTLLRLLEPSPANRPTMAQAREQLTAVAEGRARAIAPQTDRLAPATEHPDLLEPAARPPKTARTPDPRRFTAVLLVVAAIVIVIVAILVVGG